MTIFEAIENRTENWRTASHFQPMFGDQNDLLAQFAFRLGEPQVTEPSDIRLELFWKGMRDYLKENGGKNNQNVSYLAARFRHHFGDLRLRIHNFEGFQGLKDKNYTVSDEDEVELYNNLFNTEIDVVLESPNHLYIGEVKHTSPLGTDGDSILVHQLVRQFVMAKILIARLVDDGRLQAKKSLIPFVVGNDPQSLNRTDQVKFMKAQGWMKEGNVLSWADIC